MPRLENESTALNKRLFRLCELVLKHTGGNPFFIETVIVLHVELNFSSSKL